MNVKVEKQKERQVAQNLFLILILEVVTAIYSLNRLQRKEKKELQNATLLLKLKVNLKSESAFHEDRRECVKEITV